MTGSIDITGDRREYDHGELRKRDLHENPIVQFERWLELARDRDVLDATAMTLATVDEGGMPFQRTVLLKGLSDDGFVFFTNLGSRKAQQINANNKVCLHFVWHPLDRQVIITGKARFLSVKENFQYFVSRPKESQLAAWASRQSHPITARRVLEEKFREIKKAFGEGEVAVPKFWGGYRVEPQSIEFWQGGEHRLHDRFLYKKDGHSNWEVERLSP